MNSNFQIMDYTAFVENYDRVKENYRLLGLELQQEIKNALDECGISFIDVPMRVKDITSAYKKVAVKEIKKPFEEIEDWCGLRIICYYEDDINRICQMLEARFTIKDKQDVSDRLSVNEFGYRSTHLILTLDEYHPAANLRDIKAEVQVRSSLMHAWAAISHKLQYKGQGSVPIKIQRIFSQLSSMLEGVDRQFVELRKQLISHRDTIDAKRTPREFIGEELDTYNLNAFLKVTFPDRAVDQKFAEETLFPALMEADLSMSSIVTAYEAYASQPGFLNLAGELYSKRMGATHIGGDEAGRRFANTQPIALMAALGLRNPSFYQILVRKGALKVSGYPPLRWVEIIRDYGGGSQVS